MKTCIQCMQPKHPDKFRGYYGKAKGTYTQCLTCEKVNQRLKYLKRKSCFTEANQIEIDTILNLYEAQRLIGGKPPGERAKVYKLDLAAELQTAQEQKETQEAVPPELHKWLTINLSRQDPEELQDNILPRLQRAFRPQTGVDPVTFLPTFDDTYRDILNDIAKRFDDYEDSLN